MTAKSKKTVFLIDGSAMVYRAFFAFIRNPLINSKGENTSAAYGVANSLLKIFREENPDLVAMVFDTPHPTFRHKKYDEYKSTRAKMPDDLVEQLPRVRQVVEALNLVSIEMPGYEADDIIGTLAKKAERDGYMVWCVTPDKDYFQLVTDNIKIYIPKRAAEEIERLGPREVEIKFGVPPERVIDKLALMGDSSDNIPGIPGIGPKTADSLLAQFGSFEKVLERHQEIKAKGQREKVAAGLEKAKLSKWLVTIDTDVPVEISLDQLARRECDYQKTKSLFMELEFNRLLRQVMPDDAGTPEEDRAPSRTKASYHLISSLDDLKKLIASMSKSKEIAVDTETTSLNAIEADLVGVSLSNKSHSGYYIPLAHDAQDVHDVHDAHVGHEDTKGNLPFDEALAEIKKLLENPKVQKAGQNIKYDLKVLHRYGINIDPISFDSMLASYLIDPSARQHSLDMLAIKHFDHKMQPITDLIGTGKNQKSFATVPINKALDYAAEDADMTFRLRGKLAPVIDSLDLNNLYYNIELPLIKVLAAMEEEGIRVDSDILASQSKKMDSRLMAVMKEIYQIAGGEFNINSTQQISHILFEKLSLPTKGKTAKKTGYSTDVTVLEELSKLHPFPKLILHYRQLTKLKNTYIDAIPRLINERTGRVHTSFNQAIAATGRLSSTEPNLQNIPIRTAEGREIRRAFIARDKEHILLAADYSQIELRILAHYTNDEALIAAFKNNEDIHLQTASKVFDVSPSDVTPEMRRVAKTANFAIIYGVSAFGLAQQTDLPLNEAKQFIDKYFERYPSIRDYMETTKQFARDKGYVTTLYNRRRNLPEINAKNFSVRQFAERVAINTPIQGTAADIIKLAMIKIHAELKEMRSKMVLQVHDELVFDVYKEEQQEVTKIVKRGMEKIAKLKVPLVADIATGDNWLEAK